MSRRIKVAPSLLSADFSRLADEVRKAESAGADLLHIDVMDGHFVPNISIGPGVVECVRKVTSLPLDVHLMIENPSEFIKDFIQAGADMLTVHIEVLPREDELRRVISRIRAKGLKVGIALNPYTSIALITDLLNDERIFFLLMTVQPGFGGQRFIADVLPKIANLRKIYGGDIEVDGGINTQTAERVVRAGANILASGSYIFGAEDIGQAIESLRGKKND